VKYEILTTPIFDKWLLNLKDRTTKNKVLARLARVENGNFGDVKQLAEDLFELRYFIAGGIRIYYTIQLNIVVLLLNGGDKESQKKDIKKAKQLLEELE